jgi:hypothetical protein
VTKLDERQCTLGISDEAQDELRSMRSTSTSSSGLRAVLQKSLDVATKNSIQDLLPGLVSARATTQFIRHRSDGFDRVLDFSFGIRVHQVLGVEVYEEETTRQRVSCKPVYGQMNQLTGPRSYPGYCRRLRGIAFFQHLFHLDEATHYS